MRSIDTGRPSRRLFAGLVLTGAALLASVGGLAQEIGRAHV